MSAWLLGVIALIYGVCAVDMFLKGDMAQGLAFCGWTLGQIGMILITLRGTT